MMTSDCLGVPLMETDGELSSGACYLAKQTLASAMPPDHP